VTPEASRPEIAGVALRCLASSTQGVLIVRRYALTFGVVSSMPRMASGLPNAFIRHPTNFFPYAPRLPSCSGGFGDLTLTLQETLTPPRSTA